MMAKVALYLAAGAGSGLGALLRYGLALALWGATFPWATLLANGDTYLDRHLAAVVGQTDGARGIRVLGLGIGHDLSGYLRRSQIVDPERILALMDAMPKALAEREKSRASVVGGSR